jgi:hypothetical protein
MSNTSEVARPAPMEGKGAYNRSSRVQAAGLLPAVGLLEDAARTVALPPAPLPIVIADYGSSEGHNSMVPISAAIRALRDRVRPERAICVVHTDLPDNDFSALFQALSSDSDSYLAGDAAVFASAVGRSFYEQLLPAETVVLGWSSWALQWLSRIPATIPDHIQIAYSRDTTARAAFSRQAAEDWRAFLMARNVEMRQDARLVMLTMALDENGAFGYLPLLQAIIDTLANMAEGGLITIDEVQQMAIPTVGRSRTDLSAPFEETGRVADLSIENLEVFTAEDRIWNEYDRNQNAQLFGAQWAKFSRASVFPTLAAALAGGQADPRRASFFDRLEAGVAARLAAAPQKMVIPLAMLVLRKGGP